MIVENYYDFYLLSPSSPPLSKLISTIPCTAPLVIFNPDAEALNA